MQKFILIY